MARGMKVKMLFNLLDICHFTTFLLTSCLLPLFPSPITSLLQVPLRPFPGPLKVAIHFLNWFAVRPCISLPCSVTLFSCTRHIHLPWWQKQQVPLKCQYIYTRLHGITLHKTVTFKLHLFSHISWWQQKKIKRKYTAAKLCGYWGERGLILMHYLRSICSDHLQFLLSSFIFFFLLNRADYSPAGPASSNHVLIGHWQEITFFNCQLHIQWCYLLHCFNHFCIRK